MGESLRDLTIFVFHIRIRLKLEETMGGKLVSGLMAMGVFCHFGVYCAPATTEANQQVFELPIGFVAVAKTALASGKPTSPAVGKTTTPAIAKLITPTKKTTPAKKTTPPIAKPITQTIAKKTTPAIAKKTTPAIAKTTAPAPAVTTGATSVPDDTVYVQYQHFLGYCDEPNLVDVTKYNVPANTCTGDEPNCGDTKSCYKFNTIISGIVQYDSNCNSDCSSCGKRYPAWYDNQCSADGVKDGDFALAS
ncbi:hypothetical protein BDK51DRAFT_27743 [Blyttiomyces helicus]|uniref:Uncharacterized protein n=1 Tax=Blyttiomyces helicus TaxID=388810 RepID=A0A4P9W297_9FUNG|nr:hypothetical protein BDK51DRAFT_27743 [Blyttiomyces helicus]|eukprot:RKO84196.1 hypothetical protein BDK51DRAFT_27743 [Blyttiomyces helicus]